MCLFVATKNEAFEQRCRAYSPLLSCFMPNPNETTPVFRSHATDTHSLAELELARSFTETSEPQRDATRRVNVHRSVELRLDALHLRANAFGFGDQVLVLLLVRHNACRELLDHLGDLL